MVKNAALHIIIIDWLSLYWLIRFHYTYSDLWPGPGNVTCGQSRLNPPSTAEEVAAIDIPAASHWWRHRSTVAADVSTPPCCRLALTHFTSYTLYTLYSVWPVHITHWIICSPMYWGQLLLFLRLLDHRWYCQNCKCCCLLCCVGDIQDKDVAIFIYNKPSNLYCLRHFL